MGHEEEVVVSLLVEHGGNARAVRRDGALHQVAHHQRGERAEGGRQPVVGVDAGGVEMGEGQRTAVEAVERGGEALTATEGLHQTGRHRLHEDNHHIGRRAGTRKG